MSMDTIGDFLTVIRNAIMVSKRSVSFPASNKRNGIAAVLKEEGFVKDFKVEQDDSGKSTITIYLKYVDGESVIHEIKRVSKPGRRLYEGFRTMTKVIGGMGISIVTTNKGIVTDKKARELSVGGEVLCHVW